MEDQLPPIERETGSLKRFMGLLVLIQVTLVLFVVAVTTFVRVVANA
jgi:hypothetical protein